MAGRPIRFLVLVIGGWTVVRVTMLWPAGSLPVAPVMRPVRPVVRNAAMPVAWAAAPRGVPALVFRAIRPTLRPAAPTLRPVSPLSEPAPLTFASVAPGQIVAPLLPASPRYRPASRWSGSAWAALRGGGGAFNTGQLGGSQAGVRIVYALDRHWSAVARIAAPIGATGTEASLAVEWRPGRLPLRLVAERRVLLDSGRQGTAVGVVGGFGPAPIGRGVRAEGYVQAGVIRRDTNAAFVDGSLKIRRPIGPLELGVGAWGGAQPGVARLDLGPSLGLDLPVARHRLRLSLEWRQRVAGRARPGSGIALTLGSDF
jgi:hypothetical protein